MTSFELTLPPSRSSDHVARILPFDAFRMAFFALLLGQAIYFFHGSRDLGVASILAIESLVAAGLIVVRQRSQAWWWAAMYLLQIAISYAATYFFVTDWSVWGRAVVEDNSNLVDSLASIAAGIAACGLAIIVAHWRFERRPRNSAGPLSSIPLWGNWQVWFVSFWITVGVGHFFSSGLGFIDFVIQKWPVVAIMAIDTLVRSGRAPRKLLVIVWGVLTPLRMLYNLSTGFGLFLVYEGAILAFYATMRGLIRIRAWVLFAGAAVVIAAFAIRTYTRSVLWQQESTARMSRIEIAEASVVGAVSTLRNAGIGATVQAMLATRLGHYVLVAHTVVVRDTPSAIPYLKGASYRSVLWLFVPRVFYPNKPREQWGQIFGHRYDLLSPLDLDTSFNFPQLTEAYANGGIWLLIAMMALSGTIIYWIAGFTMCLDRTNDSVMWIVWPVVFNMFFQCFSNFTLSLNSSIYFCIFILGPSLLAWHSRRYRMTAPTTTTLAGEMN